MIPYFIPDMPTTEQLIPYLKEIDHNRWYPNFGPLYDKLKSNLSEKILKGIDPNRIALVSSGTAALELALKSLRLPAGSNILTSSFTFPATIEAIINVGLNPVLSDVDKDNWQLTTAIAEYEISQQDIAAVLPVATFGMPVCSESWSNFSISTGLPVVIDAAAALVNQGIRNNIIYAFSLHATKPIGAGEGGLVVCSSKHQATLIQKMSNFGIEPDRTITQIGTNAKLSEYHCAVGLANLDRLEETLTKRRQLFEYFSSQLNQQKIPFSLQAGIDKYIPANLYVVFEGATADSMSKAFHERHIETRRLYHPLIQQHPAFEGITCTAGSIESTAYKIAERGLALPFHAHLSYKEVEIIVNTLATICLG